MDMNWIPTSEKLPEALGKWTSNNSSVRKVIAWMNIPDKYEEIER